jgi:hypothetical protein
MKLILFIWSLFPCQLIVAATYYFSNTVGSDTYTSVEAQQKTKPWKSLNKLNNVFNTLIAGDSVLFKRGETFAGSIIISRSGIMSKPIVLGAYGEGAAPLVTGMATVSNWTRFRGNIYYASLTASDLSMVTLDGVAQGIGRYPNTGYLKYTGHSGNNSISGSAITALPFNATGAEVVIRKVRWIVDRQIVASHIGSALMYKESVPHGKSSYTPVDGNGFFIQNHLRTIDEEGEWYYDKVEKRLYLHFGVSDPARRKVRASVVEQLVSANSSSNIALNNLNFEGGNYAIVVQGSANIKINNCNFKNVGSTAIYALNTKDFAITGGSISKALNNGIFGEYNVNNCKVSGVKVSDCGVIAGAGSSGDGSYAGININGNGTVITNNSVTNTGYNAIAFTGNDVLVEKNFVDAFCLGKG